MKNKWTIRDSILMLCALAAFGYFIRMYPRLYPEAAIRHPMGLDEVKTSGEAVVRGMGYSLTEYRLNTSMKGDEKQIVYLQRHFGPGKTIRLLSDSIPGYFWELRWRKKKAAGDSSANRDEQERERNVRLPAGNIQLNLDMKGQPIQFETGSMETQKPPPASDERPSSEPEAKAAAETFFRRIQGDRVQEWTYSGQERRPFPDGGQFLYRWKHNRPVAGLAQTFEAGVRNGKVDFFHRFFELPKTKTRESKDKDIFESILSVVPILFFILMGIIFLIKRLRQDLMDIKSGWVIGLLVFFGWVIGFLLNQMTNETGWEIAVAFLFTTPFVVGSAWLMYSLGESFTREVWEKKLLASDLLRKRMLFPELGLAIFRGAALAFLILGLYSFFDDAIVRWFGGAFSLKDNQLKCYSVPFPSTIALGKSLMDSIFIAIAFGFFLPSFLKKYVKKIAWLVLASVPLLLAAPCVIPCLAFPFNLVPGVLVGLLCIGFFIRFDWVTLLSGLMLVPVLFFGTAFLSVNTGMFQLHGFLLLSIAVCILLWAFLCVRTNPISKEAVRFVPEYVQRIYEKQRIQRELEIARNVQLNFLPRNQPQVRGLSVASFCIPAREVGGDYYDFIYLGPKRLGVAIGDVSGKGIPAAFYMTMTKGFLKSQAGILTSPKNVLIHLNSLFYENAERGMFISMIYGVFDLETRTLTYARAGHNPMIAKRSGGGVIEELSAGGIALGLEAGSLFKKNIQEKSIRLKKGDIFFFYTDGLNEARNRFMEEFGENRLKEAIRSGEKLSTEDMMQSIRENIHAFTGDTLQHDDMTAVVVKILS